MDKLDELIQAARADVDHMNAMITDMQVKRDMAAMRLQALEEAARLRPFAVAPGSPPKAQAASVPSRTKRGGRQPGAISTEWKQILACWWADDPQGKGLDFGQIFGIAKSVNPKATEHAVYDRVRKYRDKLHLVEAMDNNRYRVKKEVGERMVAEFSGMPMGSEQQKPTLSEETVG